MAVIGAAHGIHGEVRVKTFTEDPLALGEYGPVKALDGRSFEILDIRPAGDMVVVRFKGVSDRNAAEALNGTALYVDRSALPDDTEEGEFYHADLIGLEIRGVSGEVIGKVTAVQNFGGGDLLEITHRNKKGVLIPFSEAAVPLVDVAGGFIAIDEMAAGLIDMEENGSPELSGSASETDRRPRGPKNAGENR
ncbi:ribosome maturation factor RimM [Pseudaminobacter soli (ex Zhang et al. 2022)]